ncbi:MAG: ATP-dependent Clp protease adapter ClpS [Paracoccaceae bacterium]
MSELATKPRPKQRPKTARPQLYKVILLNDDFTPREFVVTVLKGVFRMTEEQAYRVMLAAHKLGACVVAVYTREIAESKATEATEAGRSAGYPLLFTTEPEE